MTPIQQKAFDTIKEIEDIKKSTNQYPAVASLTEITNSVMIELKEAINNLTRAGKLSWYKNVNGVLMFSIKQRQ